MSEKEAHLAPASTVCRGGAVPPRRHFPPQQTRHALQLCSVSASHVAQTAAIGESTLLVYRDIVMDSQIESTLNRCVMGCAFLIWLAGASVTQ